MKKHFEMKYLPLTVSLTSLEQAELPPFLGSALRGVIGQALFQMDKEAYEFLYKKGGSLNNEKDIVRPYIINPPGISKPKTVVKKDGKISFELLLLGNAAKYGADIASSLGQTYYFKLGAKRYPFYLSEIINNSNRRVVWMQRQFYSVGMQTERLKQTELTNVSGVVIKVRTPLRIRHGGQLLRSISFQRLIRNISTRIIRLTEQYGGWVDQEEVERIQSLADDVKQVRENLYWEQMERYSNRINEKMDFSGLLGELQFEGNLDPFVPWLCAAQRLHVGRNTTFGMGDIETIFV